ncbi:FitA-like ribbon-helix-helix domain-containing protein [Rhizobium gallicum]|uniref:FitA-like ribbon-helix-helix domain-containing protein n=1 Tax=Rhizobium gallicum TaxID=56730 RepID=UPI003B8A7F06
MPRATRAIEGSQRLRIRAATHGRSMQDETRDILRTALAVVNRQHATSPRPFADACCPVGGVGA